MGLPIILVLLGVAALVYARREAHLQRRLQDKGVRVPGTVIRFHRNVSHSDAGSTTNFLPIVGFADAEGRQHEFRIDSAHSQWQKGGHVPVVYLPGSPETARVDTRGRRRRVVAGLTAAGVLCILVPIALMMLGPGQGPR